MVEIICDDQVLKKTLGKLVALLQNQGAYFHPAMNICFDGKQFKITSSEVLKTIQKIAFIPERCFVPFNSCAFSYTNGLITIDSLEEGIREVQAEIISLMVEVYNLADRFPEYMKSSVLSLFYEDKDFFEHLMEGLSFFDPEVLASCSREAGLLHHFLDNRTLSSNAAGTTEKVFVPVAEYFNNNLSAEHLYEEKGGKRFDACSLPGTDELFFHYGMIDARHIFCYEGYIEKETNIVRSIGLDLELDALINVRILSTWKRADMSAVPENLRDLAYFLPDMQIEKGKRITFAFLFIPPSQAPNALRRILYYALQSAGINEQDLERFVYILEQQIIQKNVKYYQSLLAYLSSAQFSHHITESLTEEIALMAESQLSKIKNYPFFRDIMAA